jgi:glycine/D-amino acid oxidase-like deaminating enzyme
VVVVARGPGGALPRLAAPRRTLRRALLAHSEFPLETMFQVVDSHVYGRPDSAGSLFGDGDRAFRGRDPAAPVRPDRAFLRRMCGELSEMFGAHVGCAPAGGGVIDESEDDRPFVERQQGVIVMGGLGGDGFALAPALGERIARSLAEGTDDFGLGPEEAASLAGALAMPAPDEPC